MSVGRETSPADVAPFGEQLFQNCMLPRTVAGRQLSDQIAIHALARHFETDKTGQV